jgi:two-component system, OmpR family, alkaline phosphatase synthesis response regulator PhoP
MNKRVLIVEDEPGLVMALTDCLTAEGYQVKTAGDGEAGFICASTEFFHVVILDLMLPRRNGFDVCRDLRNRGIQTPIIMLTARGQTADKVVGLKLGADDYLTKPFDMPELLARLEALLRRMPAEPHTPLEIYRFGDISVDFKRTEVLRNGRVLELSAREFRLLRYLIERRGVTISRDDLLNEVWGYDAMPTTRTVDVHVGQLRQKIERNPRDPQYILTIYGFGYKFVG